MNDDRISIPNVNKPQESPENSRQLLGFQAYCSVSEARKKSAQSTHTESELVKKVSWLRLKISKERNPRRRDGLIALQNNYLAMIMSTNK